MTNAKLEKKVISILMFLFVQFYDVINLDIILKTSLKLNLEPKVKALDFLPRK